MIVRSPIWPLIAALSLAGAAGCTPAPMAMDAGPADDERGFEWHLPANVPAPRIPRDNPMSTAKVSLGRHLFYETRLSLNATTACASCHQQIHAFSDGRTHAVGSTGEAHRRNTMSLTNAAFNAAFTWSSSTLRELEHQVRVPMYGDSPIELGIAGHETEILDRLRADRQYALMFRAAFPEDGDAAATMANIERALASFVRTLISSNSDYDRWLRGDATALSPSAQRGYELFFGDRLDCYQCHTGFNLSGPVVDQRPGHEEPTFHNTGLYDVDREGSYPAIDQGLFELTGRAADMGRFRAPTLRNIELTAPYMHDGSIATLEGVLAHYASGGRTIETGPNAGVGSANRYKDSAVHGFPMSDGEREDVLAFLRSLTDWEFVRDERLANPFVPAARTTRTRSCPDDTHATCPSDPAITPPSYRASIASIVSARCATCHRSGGPATRLPLTDHSEIARHAIAIRAQLATCRMPPAEALALTDDERDSLLTWLACDAPDN